MLIASAFGDFFVNALLVSIAMLGLLGEVLKRTSPDIKRKGRQAAFRGGVSLFKHILKK